MSTERQEAEPRVNAEDTYDTPPHGWTCFHCGETFTKPGSARDHFGTTPMSTPGCIIKAGDERGLLMALRRTEDERDEFLAQRQRAEEAEEVARGQLSEVLRHVKGARSAHDVWRHLDSLTGRAKTAEAIVAEVERLAPHVVAQARLAVCGPGTYYMHDGSVQVVAEA